MKSPSLIFPFFTTQTKRKEPKQKEARTKKKKRKTKKKIKRSIETIVRHSEVSHWSGQICQADVQSHVRSHIRDGVDSFRKLWSHHPTILPSTPCDGKSCFIPHGIPKGHLHKHTKSRVHADAGQRNHYHIHAHKDPYTKKKATC